MVYGTQEEQGSRGDDAGVSWHLNETLSPVSSGIEGPVFWWLHAARPLTNPRQMVAVRQGCSDISQSVPQVLKTAVEPSS